jgi:hypothetical protein
MSPKPIVPNPSVARLIEEGFEIEIKHQHLLVHSIPYLNQTGELTLGILACPYTEMGEQDTKPNDHTFWLRGEHPHMASGQPMHHVVNHSNQQTLFDQFVGHHYLSNKADDQPPGNFYDKVTHYHTLFVSQARVKFPNADGRTNVVHAQRDENSVFKYPDTASSRAGITAITQRLEVAKVAIVGVGGTGGYILDLIAKTPVREIHLFDQDDFEAHNAFRAPGAASFDELRAKMKKVEYFKEAYDPMRRGIVPHPYHLDESNLHELDGFDFVFIAVDQGSARRALTDYLCQVNVPFIDVGMGITRIEDEVGVPSLLGKCRVTLATANKHDHLGRSLDFQDDDQEALYKSNIQVADMNAINAAIAVLRWKQHMGFYLDQELAHNLNFTINLQSLARSEHAAPVENT